LKIAYLKKFSKDLDRIKKPKDRESILEIIKLVKQVQVFTEVSGIKKLKGYDDAFRIRSGDYRIGVFVSEELVEFARVAHRKDIYKIFP
jgi:mRNA interferase RelE/StbE